MSLIFETALEEKIFKFLDESVLRLGYEIIRVKFSGQNKQKTLQIMIDNPKDDQVNIDDCQKASIHISALLDVEDLIEEYYNLEVSSPGLDRPLTRLKDFKKFLNSTVKVEISETIEGQKKFRGILKDVKPDGKIILLLNVVRLSDDKAVKEVEIPFELVLKAKLVFE